MSNSNQTDNLEITTISRDNPYVQLADSDEDDNNLPIVNVPTSAIYINGNTAVAIQVPTAVAEKAIKIQSTSRHTAIKKQSTSNQNASKRRRRPRSNQKQLKNN